MNENKIIQKLIEHDEALREIKENMATKADIRDIGVTLDKVMAILKKLDEERMSTVQWVQRVEDVVKGHSTAIKQIQEKLNVA